MSRSFINNDLSDMDDISLDGELARQMFDDSTTKDPDTEILRLQAAKTSDDVFSRYFEGFQQKLEVSLEKINSKLSDLDHKYVELAKNVLKDPVHLDPKTSNSTNSVADQENQNSAKGSSALDQTEIVQKTFAPLQDMEIDEHVDMSDNAPQPGPSAAHCPSSFREEHYRVRKIDAVKFRTLEKKLETEEQFKYWKRSIVGQIETQECTFLLDPSENVPPGFSHNELEIAKRKVRYFILESLSSYFQDLVNDLSSPKDIMDKLQGACDPSSTFQLKRLVQDFNSIHFDPKSEKAIDFLGRFDELRKKLASLHPTMVSPDYVKTILELAITETVTYSKAELHGFKFTIAEIRDMLIEEQLRQDVSSGGSSYSMIRSRIASSRGRGGGRGGKKGYIPGKPNQPNLARRKLSSSSIKIAKTPFCVYCKRKGHTNETCYRGLKICFNCGKSNKHLAADCPFPHKPFSGKHSARPFPKSKYASNPTQGQSSSSAKRPKLFKMPLGQAKKLSEEFNSHPDAIFAIIGSKDGPETKDVWVTMGNDEVEHVSSLNFMTEQDGSGQAFHLSEDGDPWN